MKIYKNKRKRQQLPWERDGVPFLSRNNFKHENIGNGRLCCTWRKIGKLCCAMKMLEKYENRRIHSNNIIQWFQCTRAGEKDRTDSTGVHYRQAKRFAELAADSQLSALLQMSRGKPDWPSVCPRHYHSTVLLRRLSLQAPYSAYPGCRTPELTQFQKFLRHANRCYTDIQDADVWFVRTSLVIAVFWNAKSKIN